MGDAYQAETKYVRGELPRRGMDLLKRPSHFKIYDHAANRVDLPQPEKAGGVRPFQCQRLLVGLDGDPEHEQGLRAAASLAQICQAALHLVMVVRTRGTLSGEGAMAARLMPRAAQALLDAGEEEAAKYLEQHVRRLQAEGLDVRASVGRGAPAEIIHLTLRMARARTSSYS